MGEDLPLDSNQVQPPQEGQAEQQPQEGEAGHIEVAYHDDTQQPGEATQVNTEDSEPAHLGTIDHDDDPTKLTPEEEQISPDRVRNKEKAEDMARAADTAHRPNAREGSMHKSEMEWLAEKAGEEYEMGAVGEKTHKPFNEDYRPHTAEEIRQRMKSDTGSLLSYGHTIIENQRKFGEKVTPNQEAADIVYRFSRQNPSSRSDWVHNNEIEVTLKKTEPTSGRVTVEINHQYDDDPADSEQWTVTPLKSGWGKYEVTILGKDEGFTSVKTIKSRPVSPEDVERLKGLVDGVEFEEAIDEEAERRGDHDGNASDSFYAQTAGDNSYEDEHGPSYSQHLEDSGSTHNGRPI